MDASKEYLKQQGIRPKISFKGGTPHTVKLLEDKLAKIPTPEGPKEGLSYLVEEDGEEKSFFTSSVKLITMLAEVEKGETVTIQLKKVKTDQGYLSMYEINRATAKPTGEVLSEENIDESAKQL